MAPVFVRIVVALGWHGQHMQKNCRKPDDDDVDSDLAKGRVAEEATRVVAPEGNVDRSWPFGRTILGGRGSMASGPRVTRDRMNKHRGEGAVNGSQNAGRLVAVRIPTARAG